MITKLKLKNFKSFEDAEIDFGAITTLIGVNASGKSNIRDALRLLHGFFRIHSLPETIGGKWFNGVLQWEGIRGGTRELIYNGSDSDTCMVGIDFEVDIKLKDSETSREHVKGEYCVFIKIGKDSGKKLQIEREYLKIDGEINCIYDTGSSGIEMKPEHQKYAQALDDLLINIRFLDISPSAMRQPSPPGQVILSDRGENLSSVLLTICEDAHNKQILLAWLKELIPQDVVDFKFTEDLTGKILVSLVESDGRVISANSASDGTLRFLAMVVALLSPESAVCYFFEEIENGIHPSKLHLLVNLMEQRSGLGKQLVLSSHSPLLLGYLSDASQKFASLVYRGSNSKSSQVIPLLKVPHIAEVLQKEALSELHASSWLENVLEFTQED